MVCIIAEAGVNHNGNIEMAKRLVDAAADAGADYIKFQTFKAENLVTADARKAEYQKLNTDDEAGSQYEMLKKLELSEEDHYIIKNYCDEKGIGFFSTAFDIDGLRFLKDLGQRIWKIPSGEVTNFPYLREIAAFPGEFIVSTGMCAPDDIRNMTGVLEEYGCTRDRITILQCTTQYPAPMKDVNLRAMVNLSEYAGSYGLSDHTKGIEVPVAAAALGASVIEKHFTLSRDLPGPDHKASLEPQELKAMVQAIRNVELALGDGVKKVAASECGNIAVARKSIVASRPIKRGEILTEENLTTKRPGDGISPMRWLEVVGTVAVRDFQVDEEIEVRF